MSVSSASVVQFKPTAFTIPFESDAKSSSSNLQEAFKTYRDFKLDGIKVKINEANKYLRKGLRSNPDRMMRLRMKFVEQAKKYFDVPYAKKYFSPDSPEYHSSLFLDCCGLVRKVMRDLEYDFGFRIGGGNQAYMFDTLPKTIDRLEDVKPGDLVFISAIYYNPKMKKQPHNITHVEIMLGEGEKTIGARWNNGKVQIFDSYKFVSKSYHSQVYYIKSIDPWLLGLCRSYCTKHPWRYNTALRNKKSIFSPDYKKLKRSGSNKNLSTKKKTKKKKKKKRSKSKTKVKSLSDTTSQESSNSVQNILFKSKIIRELESELNMKDESDSNESDDEYDENDENDTDEVDQVEPDENCECEEDENAYEYATDAAEELAEEEEEEGNDKPQRGSYDDSYLENNAKINRNFQTNQREMRPFTCVERNFKKFNLND